MFWKFICIDYAYITKLPNNFDHYTNNQQVNSRAVLIVLQQHNGVLELNVVSTPTPTMSSGLLTELYRSISPLSACNNSNIHRLTEYNTPSFRLYYNIVYHFSNNFQTDVAQQHCLIPNYFLFRNGTQRKLLLFLIECNDRQVEFLQKIYGTNVR